MKNLLMSMFVATVTLVGGCQATKGVENTSSSFQQPNKRIVQQKMGELLAMSGVEVRWNKYRGRNFEEDMLNFVLGGEGDMDFFDFFDISCTPQPTLSYPTSRQSVRLNELYGIAMLSGFVFAVCDADAEVLRGKKRTVTYSDAVDFDADAEVYRAMHKGSKRGVEMLQQLGLFDSKIPLMRASVVAPWACVVDAMVQEYKQENPGRPVDADVLNWLKDNKVLECDHSGTHIDDGLLEDHRAIGAHIDDNLLEVRLRSQLRQDESLGDAVNISVTSFNGIVLLTGEVNTDEQRQRAGEIVTAEGTARKVVNELELAGKTSVIGRANDALLTSKVKFQLTKDENTAPTIKVVTEHGKVYLLGLVTQAEADAAVESALAVSGVTHIVKVFEYIE